MQELKTAFKAQWKNCCGRFNDTENLSSLQNLAEHHQKHVVLGNEWGAQFSPEEYLRRATAHLNSVDDEVIELMQVENQEVVKYNLMTGEVGLARSQDGLIKTFFRPGGLSYVLRKIEQGLWVAPQPFESQGDSVDVDMDPENRWLLETLSETSLELPDLVVELTKSSASDTLSDNPVLLNILKKLGRGRFAVYELKQRVLPENTKDVVLQLREDILRAEAYLYTLELRMDNLFGKFIEAALEELITQHGKFWEKADHLITSPDDFELALEQRDALGFLMMETGVLKIQGMLSALDLDSCRYELLRKDIYFRAAYYRLMSKIRFQQEKGVYPKEFFWRKPLGCFTLRPIADLKLHL